MPAEEPSRDELVAWSLDGEVELLALLPELLADLDELGASVAEVLQILQHVALQPGSRVLDLGCGKGAVAVALAERFGCTVRGIDGMKAFVARAAELAAEHGVAGRCTFAVDDVREAVARERGYDLVCLLALGDVLGRADATVASLRECVVPGGLMLIDDAYLPDGAVPPEDLVHCFDHETTVALLTACGDELVAELAIDGPESRGRYDAMTAAIAARGDRLAARHPELAPLVEGYVERQREEVEVLTGPVAGALWLLRRGPHAPRGA